MAAGGNKGDSNSFVRYYSIAALDSAWWKGREKNKTILGTWNNDAFQVSLRYREAGEDPLVIPLLHEMLPYFCIPQW